MPRPRSINFAMNSQSKVRRIPSPDSALDSRSSAAGSVLSLDRYVGHSMKKVKGFLTSLDALTIQALLTYQCEKSIRGDLCEIGVHHGRLFLMLALARRTGERAIAIDLFEDDSYNANTDHAGRDTALFENARRLGIEFSEDEIFKTSSLDIGPSDILARTTGPVRFFSVDGGHLYHHVENDLRLAESTLAGEGVIAIDDFFNIGWVDVSFATYDFLRQTSALMPFAVTPKKLYLAPSAAADNYKAALRKRTDFAHIERVEILGSEVLALQHGLLKRGYDALRNSIARHAF